GKVIGVAIDNSYAYLAEGGDGMRIVDIENLANPVEIGQIDTDGQALNIVVEGYHAYVADREGGLRIFKVSEPDSPDESANFTPPGNPNIYSLAVENGLAYLGGIDVLHILDVSNPEDPIHIASQDMDGLIEGIAIHDHFVYCAANDGITILDVADPSNPDIAEILDLPGAKDVFIQHDYAYVAARWNGFHIFDIDRPDNPVQTGYYMTESWAQSVVMRLNLAYIADGDDGLYIISNDDSAIEDDNICEQFRPGLWPNYPNPFRLNT
ncbi:MAG: hypothetical protein GY869_11190, partial [Planctomycetes bacterium]|nr:hypothetical protein [Planctomycetota bacterium]